MKTEHVTANEPANIRKGKLEICKKPFFKYFLSENVERRNF